MLEALHEDEKLRLMRFMCAFAWSDLDVTPRERTLILGLADTMRLTPDGRVRVEGWLEHPPSEEDLDPYDIPSEHRRMFREAALRIVQADGQLDPLEAENFAIFAALMTDGGDRTEEIYQGNTSAGDE